jgi:hypothetical protein
MDMAGECEGIEDVHPFGSLWAFHLRHAGTGWCVAGRFAVVPLKASCISMSTLGLEMEQEYHAFDFWAQAYLGRVEKEAAVPGLEIGCCQIVALRKVEDRPQLIASSRHVSMDSVSLKKETWDGSALHLELQGVPGTTETYFLHDNGSKPLPRGINCKGARVQCQAEDGICKLQLFFENEAAFVSPPFLGKPEKPTEEE